MRPSKHLAFALASLFLSVNSAPAQDKAKPEPLDWVARKYQPELDRIKGDYDAKVRAIQLRMIAEYEIALSRSLSAKDLESANAIKSKIDAIKSKTVALPDQASVEFRLVGAWKVLVGGNPEDWRINKDHTFKPRSETGNWRYENGTYYLNHNWDWKLRLIDDTHFEGVCVRGNVGTKVKGTRSGE